MVLKKYILSQVNLVKSHPKTIKIYLVLVTGRILGGENITYFSYVAIFEKVHDKVRWILFFSQITLLMYIGAIYMFKKYILIYRDDFLTTLKISKCVSFSFNSKF